MLMSLDLLCRNVMSRLGKGTGASWSRPLTIASTVLTQAMPSRSKSRSFLGSLTRAKTSSTP